MFWLFDCLKRHGPCVVPLHRASFGMLIFSLHYVRGLTFVLRDNKAVSGCASACMTGIMGLINFIKVGGTIDISPLVDLRY